jgi:flavin-dependent dehydrogenase
MRQNPNLARPNCVGIKRSPSITRNYHLLSADVVIAGGGISGLLLASALGSECSVILLEQNDCIPRNKYWLTDDRAANRTPSLSGCIDRRYEYLDFIAYDGLRARVHGRYCLWDTDKLIEKLIQDASRSGTIVLTGHRLYSICHTRTGILVRANSQTISARLLVDCMGFGSPLVGATNVAAITGYYIVHGCELRIAECPHPVALDNVIVGRNPAFFELFPTSKGTAHAAIILPCRQHTPSRSIKGEFNFILSKSHYSEQVIWDPQSNQKSYFGIVPVGRLYEPALDRIVFFGEAGQANPAASATGLTRMLHTYQELAGSLLDCLRRDALRRNQLSRATPTYMTRMNRAFHESLFESILSYNSADFRRLVNDLTKYPHETINDLIFADFNFRSHKTLSLALDTLMKPRNILGWQILKAMGRLVRS